jgi:hypothetical protein
MRQFPVQHRTHAIGTDDEIAVAKIAVHQRHFARWTGIALAQPAQRQLEHRARPVEGAVVPLQLGDFFCGRHAAQFG